MGEIRNKLKMAGGEWTTHAMVNQLDRVGETIESELKKLEERIEGNPLAVAVSLDNQDERIGILESRLENLRAGLKQHQEAITGLESSQKDIKYLKEQVELNLRAIEKIENQLMGDELFDVRDIHRRLNIHRKELNQCLDALEQKPLPEPARDTDKNGDDLKFGDLVRHSERKQCGIFIEGSKDCCDCNGVLETNGEIHAWHRGYTVFKARPKKPQGDCP